MQEFSAISVSTYSADGLAEKLTEASREGWEVVSIVNAGSSITAYLQRPASDAAPAQPDAEPDTEPDTAEAAPVAEAPVIEAPVIDEPVVEELVIEELAIDEPATITPTEPASEPDASTEAPVVDAPADDIVEEVAQPSLADELAALVPQLGDTSSPDPEPELPGEPEPAPAEEPASSFALGGATERPAEPAAEPATPEPEPADATPADTPAAGGSDAAAAPGAAPQGWYDDPSGRFQYRYWDGRQWTEHVSRDGQQYTDPPVA